MITVEMNIARVAIVVLALWATLAVAQKPKTVDEAVQILKTKWLKPHDMDWIQRNPKEKVVRTLYRPFGTGVRNAFGLWGDNEALRDPCGSSNPEECSVVIFNHLWESVRGEADPALLRQLDCQFQLVQTLHVSLKGFHGMTTREMVRRLQSQIDSQLGKLTTSSTTVCETSLSLEVAGKPDMSCFVVAPHGRNAGISVGDMTLDQALGVLGLQNQFSTYHSPPKITLEFARKCQFPQPFPF
jgi:hypothetical protein